MAKGKPTSKISKGASGRKNHGPKRYLNHDIQPKALRMSIAKSGALSKYHSFDSFCLYLQSKGVRADYRMLWAEFRAIKTFDKNGEPLPDAQARLKDFFLNINEIAAQTMKKAKKA